VTFDVLLVLQKWPVVSHRLWPTPGAWRQGRRI